MKYMKEKSTRRDFLTKTVIGATGVTLLYHVHLQSRLNRLNLILY